MDNNQYPYLVDPSVSLIHESDPYKKIELAGRTCYKSEDKITKGSAPKFVRAMINNGHMAMVEHAVLVFQLKCRPEFQDLLDYYISILEKTDFVYVTFEPELNRVLVSANVRAILERTIHDVSYEKITRTSIYDSLYKTTHETYPEFISDPIHIQYMDYITKEVTADIVDIRKIQDLTLNEFLHHFHLSARFITDRGVSHELVRHRLFSYAQESTRYCNYTKDKFGNHVTICKPSTYDSWTDMQKIFFNQFLFSTDYAYSILTKGEGLLPQSARAVLPNCLKTEIVVTGPAFEWQHFFNLRSKGVSGSPHPDIKYVADDARKKMNKYIKSLKFNNDLRFN